MSIKKERIKKNCLNCGNPFEVLPSRIHVNYCSSKCRNVSRSQHSTNKFNGNRFTKVAERVNKNCLNCDKEFSITKYLDGNGKGKYCSKVCKDKAHENSKLLKCNHCGKEYLREVSHINESGNNFCSKTCANSFFFSGEKHWKWNGGKKLLTHGYIGLLAKDDERADRQGYYSEHRLVMEKHIGRKLKPEEVVHHINEIRTDNRIENLMLFANQKEHGKHHAKLRKAI